MDSHKPIFDRGRLRTPAPAKPPVEVKPEPDQWLLDRVAKNLRVTTHSGREHAGALLRVWKFFLLIAATDGEVLVHKAAIESVREVQQ